MKELVEVIAKALVNHPESVHVTEFEGDRETELTLTVDPADPSPLLQCIDQQIHDKKAGKRKQQISCQSIGGKYLHGKTPLYS